MSSQPNQSNYLLIFEHLPPPSVVLHFHPIVFFLLFLNQKQMSGLMPNVDRLEEAILYQVLPVPSLLFFLFSLLNFLLKKVLYTLRAMETTGYRVNASLSILDYLVSLLPY